MSALLRRADAYRPLTADEVERALRPGPECLDCGHESRLHEPDTEARCILCDCDSLHLDVGDCNPECYVN